MDVVGAAALEDGRGEERLLQKGVEQETWSSAIKYARRGAALRRCTARR